MKEFVVLVYNIEMVNSKEIVNLKTRIESECDIVVFTLPHQDPDANPFYLAPLTRVTFEKLSPMVEEEFKDKN